MKDQIEEARSKNGNEKLTQKDLLWYLVNRVDGLHDKIMSQVNTCSNKYITQKSFYWFSGVVFTLLLLFGGVVLGVK